MTGNSILSDQTKDRADRQSPLSGDLAAPGAALPGISLSLTEARRSFAQEAGLNSDEQQAFLDLLSERVNSVDPATMNQQLELLNRVREYASNTPRLNRRSLRLAQNELLRDITRKSTILEAGLFVLEGPHPLLSANQWMKAVCFLDLDPRGEVKTLSPEDLQVAKMIQALSVVPQELGRALTRRLFTEIVQRNFYAEIRSTARVMQDRGRIHLGQSLLQDLGDPCLMTSGELLKKVLDSAHKSISECRASFGAESYEFQKATREAKLLTHLFLQTVREIDGEHLERLLDLAQLIGEIRPPQGAVQAQSEDNERVAGPELSLTATGILRHWAERDARLSGFFVDSAEKPYARRDVADLILNTTTATEWKEAINDIWRTEEAHIAVFLATQPRASLTEIQQATGLKSTWIASALQRLEDSFEYEGGAVRPGLIRKVPAQFTVSTEGAAVELKESTLSYAERAVLRVLQKAEREQSVEEIHSRIQPLVGRKDLPVESIRMALEILNRRGLIQNEPDRYELKTGLRENFYRVEYQNLLQERRDAQRKGADLQGPGAREFKGLELVAAIFETLGVSGARVEVEPGATATASVEWVLHYDSERRQKIEPGSRSLTRVA